MTAQCHAPAPIECAVDLIRDHVRHGPRPTTPACAFRPCIEHDTIPTLLAQRVAALSQWVAPVTAADPTKITVSFECTDENAPEGFVPCPLEGRPDDPWMRPVNSAGGLLLNLRPRDAFVHVVLDFDVVLLG